MLLAQTPLSSRKDYTRHEHAILEPETRRKRGKGPSPYEVASVGGVEGPRRLGVLDSPLREPSQEARSVPRIRPKGNRSAATNQARFVALGAPFQDFQTRETSNPGQQAAGTKPIPDIDTASALPHTLPMNITLSVEDQVIERARERAGEMGETLEQALEDYVRELADKPERSKLLPRHRTVREQIYRLG